MSLAAGPGRAGGAAGQVLDELKLAMEKHVAYIQSLDTVRQKTSRAPLLRTDTNSRSSVGMSSSTISLNTSA